MRKYLFLLFLLIATNAHAGGQQTLVTPDGRVFGDESNPLQVTIVGGGGGTPGGNEGSVQINSGGALSGDEKLTYNPNSTDTAFESEKPTVLGGGLNVPAGKEIQSGGYRINYPLYVYSSGTVYSLTNSSALVDFGTVDPTIIIDKPGVWEISGGVQLKYAATTFAANQTATCKLRRTNNTAADLTNATRTIDLRIITTITDNAGYIYIPPVPYYTSNFNDTISIYCALSAAPGAGSVDAVSAEIISKRLR